MKWLLLTWLLAALPSAPKLSVKVGDHAPAFSLQSLEGKEIPSTELKKDRPLLLIFWCTTCGSCRMVEKEIETFIQKNKEQARVVIVASNVKDTPKRIQEFLTSKNLDLPVLRDAGGKVAHLFHVHMTTTTVLIDTHNKVRYWGEFGHKEPLAARALESVLQGQPVAREIGPTWG